MLFWKKLTTTNNKQRTPEVRAISAAKTNVEADADADADADAVADADAAAELSNYHMKFKSKISNLDKNEHLT